TSRRAALKSSRVFSQSPGERAGVRRKVTLAVRTALAQNSADHSKGRMALSHSFFHASGFAGGRRLHLAGRKLEPPHVGCYGSRAQRAEFSFSPAGESNSVGFCTPHHAGFAQSSFDPTL